MERFDWHPSARLYGPDGVVLRGDPAIFGVQSDRSILPAMSCAFGPAPFRIGAVDAPAPVAGFETLTSGSTGAPRRIARSVASWAGSFAVNAGVFGIGPGVRVAVLGRLTQSLSLYAAVEAVSLGADVHVLDKMRPDRQRAALARRGVSVIWAAPPQMRLLVEAGGPPLPLLRHVILGGAKLDAGLRAALATLCPHATLHEFYGAAEASFIALADATTPPHAVGRPYPGVQIGIGAPGGAADQGQIWVRSPYLFAGYAGADAGVAQWADGWLGLGDVGRMEGGQLVIIGRTDRMVTIAGQNAYPEAIEQALLALPGVTRAAVLPRRDTARGHVLVAVIMGDIDPSAALATLRAQFGPLLAPKTLHLRADWPLLPSGKADLAALAAALTVPQ